MLFMLMLCALAFLISQTKKNPFADFLKKGFYLKLNSYHTLISRLPVSLKNSNSESTLVTVNTVE